MTLQIALERQRQYLDQVNENSARLARVAMFYDSVGNGELQIAQPVKFGITFLEEPTVATGVSLTSGHLVDQKFPNCTAGVYSWVTDDKGYYTGAYLFFVVDSNNQDYLLRHSLVFEGQAVKLYIAELLQ